MKSLGLLKKWCVRRLLLANLIAISALSLVFLTSDLLAQSSPRPPTQVQVPAPANSSDFFESITPVPQPIQLAPVPRLAPEPQPISAPLFDPETQAAQEAYLQASYRYQEFTFDHRRAVFEWQLRSSILIFGAVIALVFAGMYFSWMQFRSAYLAKEGAAMEKQPTTTLEASLQGIKVSSPVLGVVILAISLAFFYLYLTHVYPISEVM